MSTTNDTQTNLIKNISFFGDAQTPREHPDYVLAYQTARLLAQHNYAIVNGGGPGIMDASTQGAESVDGYTIAVSMQPKDTSSFEGRYLPNLDKVDKEYIEHDYFRRLYGLVEHSDLFLLFRGGSGTLSELGMVWVLANIYFGRHKPFILVGDFWWQIVDVLHQHMNLDEQEMACFTIAEDPQQVLDQIVQFEWKLQQTPHPKANPEEQAFVLEDK